MEPLGEGAAERWREERQGALDDIAAWGCPVGLAEEERVAELDGDLEVLLRGAERVIGAEVGSLGSTCPFASLHDAPEWVVELTTAVSLAVDWSVPMPDVLGRDLTAADVQGLDALKRAQGACWRREQEIAAAKRDEEDRKRKGRGR